MMDGTPHHGLIYGLQNPINNLVSAIRNEISHEGGFTDKVAAAAALSEVERLLAALLSIYAPSTSVDRFDANTQPPQVSYLIPGAGFVQADKLPDDDKEYCALYAR